MATKTVKKKKDTKGVVLKPVSTAQALEIHFADFKVDGRQPALREDGRGRVAFRLEAPAPDD